MATTALQKFLDQLSKNKNVQSVVTEFNKLSDELKKRGKDLNDLFNDSKNRTLNQAQSTYQDLVNSVNETQAQLDREVERALARISSSAKEVEKNLEHYRKKVVAHKKKVEGLIKKQSAKARTQSKKKATVKKAKATGRKKAARKTTRSR